MDGFLEEKLFILQEESYITNAAWMSDESPSCNVGLRFIHVNTLMYLTFRTYDDLNKMGFMYHR